MKSINKFENIVEFENEDNITLIEDVLKEYSSGIKHYMHAEHLTHKESWVFKRGYAFAIQYRRNFNL